MNVEKQVLNFLPYFLDKSDPQKSGVAIDIGVGTSNFYCEVFAKCGFKTFAVEPLPIEDVKRLGKQYDIELVQACIYLSNNNVEMYTGQFRGEVFFDVSSVNSNWWGINEESKKVTVPAYTFNSFVEKFSINNISYLKIDTEGSEWEIIQQLKLNTTYELPKIIEFEYGGGCIKKEATSGWSDEYFHKTINCLNHFKELGYSYFLFFEAAEKKVLKYEFLKVNNFEELFKDYFEYGNIVVIKENKYFDFNELRKKSGRYELRLKLKKRINRLIKRIL